MTELIIVSDLHLDGRPAGGVALDRGAAFAAFLQAMARGSTASDLRLVLLGDLVDLPASGPAGGTPEAATRAWQASAVAALEGVVEARPGVFEGLRALLEAGASVDIVPGNHDQALALPGAWSRLADAIGAGPGTSLVLHPWILYLPGVLYAEHGHQHHDLSVIPMLLRPDARADAPCAPLGRRLEALAAARAAREPGAIVGACGALAGDLVRFGAASRALAPARATYRADSLASRAGAIGLPADVLGAIDARGDASLAAIARRLAARRLAALRGRPNDPAGYLGPAARAIHAQLAPRGLGVPLYAFGHTHAPLIEPLAGPVSPPWIVNAGAWAPLRPASLARRVGPGRRPFVRVHAPGPDVTPSVELRLWDAAAQREEPFPG